MIAGADGGHQLFHRIGDDVIDVERHLVQFHQASGNARHVQQIVDQTGHVVHLATDNFAGQVHARLGQRTDLKQLGRGADGRQRIAQFMGQHGQELVLPAVVLAQPFRTLAQGFFVGLACADVDGRPDNANALALFVEQTAAPGGDPANYLVFLADGAVLRVVLDAPLRIGRRGKGCQRALPVVRMDSIVKIAQGDRTIRRYAKHGFDTRRPEHRLGFHVHIPFANVGGVDGQSQQFFALAQSSLGQLAVVDVGRGAEPHIKQSRFRVPVILRAYQEPAIFATG